MEAAVLQSDIAAALLEATMDDTLKRDHAVSRVIAFASSEETNEEALAGLIGALRQRMATAEAGGIAGFRAKIKAMDLVMQIFRLEAASAFRHAASDALAPAVDALTHYASGEGEPADAAAQVHAVSKRLQQMIQHRMSTAPNSGEISVSARSKRESVITLQPQQQLRWSFTVSKYDILFSMSVRGTRHGWEERRVVVEPLKLHAIDGTVTGEYMCEPTAMDAGSEILTFHFDNSYSKLRDKVIAFRLEIVTLVGTPRARHSHTAMGAEKTPGTQVGSSAPALSSTTTTIEDLVARNQSGDSAAVGIGRLSFVRSRSASTSGSESDSGSIGAIGRTSTSLLARVSAAVSSKEIAWDAPPDQAEHDLLVSQWRQDVLPHWAREKSSKSTCSLIAAGVPPEVRPMLWRAAVGNALGITRESYERLLQEVSASKKADAVQAHHAVGETPRHLKLRGLINTDLGRTVAGVGIEFAREDSAEQNELRQVLEAFAAYRPDFGYVQGMSFVAATLLVHTADVSQLRNFTRESLGAMPLSQLTKLAAAEGVEPADLEVALRSENRLESVKRLLLDLLPPEQQPAGHEESTEPEPELQEVAEGSVQSDTDSWEMVSPSSGLCAGSTLVVPLDDFESPRSKSSGSDKGVTNATHPQLITPLELHSDSVDEGSIYDDSDDHQFLGRTGTSEQRTMQPKRSSRRQSVCSWNTGLQTETDTALPVRDSFHAFVLLANIIDEEKNGRILLALMRMEADKMDILFSYFNSLLSDHAPQLHSHFSDTGIQPQMYLIEWLFTLFSKCLPKCVTAWIWDHIFVFGDSYIFSAAIGILKFLEPHLLQQDEMTVGKLLKNIVACRMQFEQDHTYPIEAYEQTALWRDYFKIVNGVNASRTDSKRWQTFQEQLLRSPSV